MCTMREREWDESTVEEESKGKHGWAYFCPHARRLDQASSITLFR